MPWNEPGGNDKNNNLKKDPWGGRNPNQAPPDLDKIIGDFFKKLRAFFSSNKKNNNFSRSFSSNNNKDHHYGLSVAVLVVLFIWCLSGLFIVNPAEEAVVLRFGKYAENLKPGLHWMARFIDKKYIVDVQKIYSFSLQGDFLTKSSEQDDSMIKKVGENIGDQSKNLVNVELNVQYRISDLRAYLFNIVNPDETVQHVVAGALSDVIGKMKLDDVLTTGREYVSSGVLTRTKDILTSYQSGLNVVAVTLRKIQAPDQVRAAFNDVNRADQDKATYIQQAQAYASKVVPIAQGLAARAIADANGYQQQIVLTAEAHVAKYQALSKAYLASPQVTRERLYLETIQNILKNSSKILIDAGSSNMLYLPLDKLQKQQNEPDAEPTTGNDDSNGSNSQLTQSALTMQSASEVKNESN